MKSIYLIPILLFASSCCWFGDCDPDPILGCMDTSSPNFNPNATQNDGTCISCEPVQNYYINSFNQYLANGAPVANLKLEQNYLTYNFQCDQNSGGPVQLTVTSTASVPLRIDYLLQGMGASGLVVWSYSGTISRLAPNDIYIQPQVVVTPVRVNVGARVIFNSVIQVP